MGSGGICGGRCFSLAWAQQLKNKDIPEGGSKAVCLVEPVPGADREDLLHGCVKRFTDGLLDLLTPDPAVVNQIAFAADQKPDLLYLGPDENITTTDIDWIVERAEQRGYPLAQAFMSSKPRAGINHKVSKWGGVGCGLGGIQRGWDGAGWGGMG